MKKQNLMIVSVFVGVLMLSLVSAGWFSNIFTGKVISDSQTVTLREGTSATFDIGGETYRLTNLKQNGELSCFDWSSISSHERQNVCVGTKEKTIKINSQTFKVKRTKITESFGKTFIELEINLEGSQKLSPSNEPVEQKQGFFASLFSRRPKEPVEDHNFENPNNGNPVANLASGDFSGTGYAFACFDSAGKLFRSDIACDFISAGNGNSNQNSKTSYNGLLAQKKSKESLKRYEVKYDKNGEMIYEINNGQGTVGKNYKIRAINKTAGLVYSAYTGQVMGTWSCACEFDITSNGGCSGSCSYESGESTCSCEGSCDGSACASKNCAFSYDPSF